MALPDPLPIDPLAVAPTGVVHLPVVVPDGPDTAVVGEMLASAGLVVGDRLEACCAFGVEV